MPEPITRLAIVNRGVAAMRLVLAAREYGLEQGRTIRTVVLHTDEEADSLPVREADAAVSVGPQLSLHVGNGRPAAADLDRLARALRASGADAVWIGWGPMAREPQVAQVCEDLGLTIIGPSAAALRTLADRDALAELAGDLGLPLADEAERPSGLRQVEALAVADQYGTAWTVSLQDGTVQRRSEKVLTETPTRWVPDPQRLAEDARRLLLGAGFVGAGTVSFLVQPEAGTAALLHVSAGLPLGHPVTELCAPVDLATIQLRIAQGAALEPQPPALRGHAIAVRLLAEDAEAGFAPTPGRVVALRPPTGPGLRVDTGLAEGDEVLPERDATVAEVAAWGATREEARARLRLALVQLPVVLEGGLTNKGFLLDLLDRPEIRDDTVDTGWLDRLAVTDELTAEHHADVAVLMAAVDAYDADLSQELTRFHAAARRGRPHARPDVGHTVELLHRGLLSRVHVAKTGPGRYRATIWAGSVDLDVDRLGAFQSWISLGGRRYRVVSAIQGGDHLVEVEGVPHRLTRDDHGVVTAPVPGVVVGLPVAEGAEVATGETVVVLESMKMESAVRAPFSGRVRELLTAANVQVDVGAPLLRIDPPTRPTVTEAASWGLMAQTAVEESAGGPDAQPDEVQRCGTALDTLQRLVLGYDIDPAEASAAAAGLAAGCAEGAGSDPAVIDGELRLLATYADLRALFRSQRERDESDLMVRSPQEHLLGYLRAPEAGTAGLPPRFVANLHRALAHYGVDDDSPLPRLEEALYWIYQSQQREPAQAAVVVGVLQRWLRQDRTLDEEQAAQARATLRRLVTATAHGRPVIADLARDVRFRLVDEPVLAAAQRQARTEALTHLAALADEPDGPERAEHVAALVACPYPLAPLLLRRMRQAAAPERLLALEVMTLRYHRDRRLGDFHGTDPGAETGILSATAVDDGTPIRVFTTAGPLAEIRAMAAAVARRLGDGPADSGVQVDLYTWDDDPDPDLDALSESLAVSLRPLSRPDLQHVVVAVGGPGPQERISTVRHLTFRPGPGGTLTEDRWLRGLHPMMARRLNLWRLSEFDLRRLPATEDVYLFHGVARDNPSDERLFAVAEVRDLTPVRDAHGRVVQLPQLEQALLEAFEGMRHFQAPLPPDKRLQWNRVMLYVWPAVDLDDIDMDRVARGLAPATLGLGLEEVLVDVRRVDRSGGGTRHRVVHLSSRSGTGFVLQETDPPTEPLQPLDEYTRKVVQSRRRGTVYPYELTALLTSPHAGGRTEVTGGRFVELDLDADGVRLVPVERPPGRNTAGIVAGLVTSVTDRYPEGMTRVALLGDPTKALGSLAEAECRRILAALDLAEQMRVPLEWYALSAGARIAMDSGTENMDWIADVLRRIIEFTQAGCEFNVVVTGINVGAQPYWNAEGTMLMHTKGILVMTPDSAMVLTGKQALDYSGSVSAEDNYGIGGYERIMGPNGQGQYWAPDLPGAVGVLLAHYDHTYVAPGERFPRRARTVDPPDRDVRPAPHRLAGSPLTTVGEVLSDETNPGRKLPFDIRSVMQAVVDTDHAPLERWRDMADSDTVVVWDAHLGGWPVCLLGIEGHAIQRRGILPADGPEQWTSGTLFPMSSKKTARAVNASSGNRPLVVLANLSGFDGSPESMRKVQLEYGAEIGRAVVNFRGPIVFCVVSRYHGGAFVVFSQKLNPDLETIAVEGSHASVIGGTPAAAVVFAGEVKGRTRKDPRVLELQAALAEATGSERARLRAELADLTATVHSEKIGEVAAEFDHIHDVERARRVGSVSRIIAAADLRPVLVAAVERGIERELERLQASG